MLIQRFHPYVGGAETQLKALIPHLRERGVEVHVLTRPEPSTPMREVLDGARVYRASAPDRRGLASLAYTGLSLADLHRHRQEIQVVHAHGLLSPATTALLAGVLLGAPSVVTTHGFLADLALLRHGPLGLLRLKLLARGIDRFVVISDEIGMGLREHGVPSRKLVPIRNGIDVDRFRPLAPEARAKLRARLGVGTHRVAIYVGRLEPVKGADVLLDAWLKVRESVPDAVLLIAGDGSARAGLERRNVSGVRFLGSQSDPLPLYQAADCYVMPSRSEGLPVALLEALSVGVPVVATAVGGATEILRGYESTALVSRENTQALADRLIARLLATDAGEQESLRTRVGLEYSIQTTAGNLAELYRSLVRGRVP